MLQVLCVVAACPVMLLHTKKFLHSVYDQETEMGIHTCVSFLGCTLSTEVHQLCTGSYLYVYRRKRVCVCVCAGTCEHVCACMHMCKDAGDTYHMTDFSSEL